MGLASSRTRQVSGRPAHTAAVLGLTVAGGSSVVTLASSNGPGPAHDVVMMAAPDPALARRLTAGMRRLAWVMIDTTGASPRCEVFGVARRPRHQRLPLAAALALADADIHTVVRTPAQSA